MWWLFWIFVGMLVSQMLVGAFPNAAAKYCIAILNKEEAFFRWLKGLFKKGK